MNYIDIIFLIIILFFTVMGLRKGLVRSAGGIIAIILGFYGASIFYSQFSLWLQGLTSIFSETVANILSFVLVFIIVIGHAFGVCSR
jgi:membrane protein required for colicin V production